MSVKPFVKRSQNSSPNARLSIRDTNTEQLLYHIADDLKCVIARLVHDRIPKIELAACQGGCLADFWVVVFDVFDGDVSDELIKNVT